MQSLFACFRVSKSLGDWVLPPCVLATWRSLSWNNTCCLWPKSLERTYYRHLCQKTSNVLSGKKGPKALPVKRWKSAGKTIAMTSFATGFSKRDDARACTSNKPIASVSESARPIAAPWRAGRDEAGGRAENAPRWTRETPSPWWQTRDNKLKKLLIEKNLLREVGPIYSLVWHSSAIEEPD